MLNAPQNLYVTSFDGSARSTWTAVHGADGYILKFYNKDEPDKCIKSRYAQGTTKLILGFKNGREYLVRVCAFRYLSGREVIGELSQPALFVPICRHLKAQNIITVQKGKTAQIVWEHNNKTPHVVFSSDNESIATVNANGRVTAVRDGNAVITLTEDSGDKFQVKVAVGRDMSRCSDSMCIMLCGDIMCSLAHQRKESSRALDFGDTLMGIKNTLSSADYSVAVLETVCCDSAPYEYEKIRTDKGSPNCNSPSTFLRSVKNCGIKGLVTANNHNCDAGIEGLSKTVEQIKRNGIDNIGTLDDEIHYVSKNGIKVAIVAFNFISNGLEGDIPLHTIGKYDRERFLSLISEAKNEHSDYIIVYAHFGQMNSLMVRHSQREEAEFMANNGADIIIGSHPHTPQRSDIIRTADGKEVPCFYSLGNLFSSMSEMRENRETAIVSLSLAKTENVVRAKASYIPVLCKDIDDGYSLRVLNGTLTAAEQEAYERIKNIIGVKLPCTDRKFLLQGSAILRKLFISERFSYDDTALILSPVSLMSEKSLPCDTAENPRLALDTTKSFEKYIADSNADSIVIDLYTMAAVSCYKYGESYYTASKLFLNSEFYKNNADKLEKVSPPYDKELWKRSLDEYAKVISKHFDKNNIILIRLSFGDMCVKHDQLRNCRQNANLNKRLSLYEDYLISLLQPVVIDVAKYYFTDGDSNQVASFEPLFYDDVNEKISAVTEGRADRFYLDKADVKIWLRRVIRYYDNMTARAYQKRLLDSKYASDRIIEYSSKQFTAENAEYLIYLRDKQVKSYDDAKRLLKANFGAEKMIKLITALQCIEGDISCCSYDDIRIIFDENLRAKKLLASKLTPVYRYVSEDNCEQIFLIRNDEAELKEYEKAFKPTVVDIWGSCISRETVNRNKKSIFVDKYIFKQPLLLTDEPDMPFDEKIGADSFCGSSWRRRTVKDAFCHAGKSILQKSEANWLIVDMYDIICGMMKYRGSLFEVDDFILRTDFYRNISGECVPSYIFSEKSKEYCDNAMHSFCKFVRQRYNDNIILIKADLKDRYISLDKKLGTLSDSDNTLNEKKEFIARYENLFAQATGCYVIDISKHFYADDSFALGGAHIVHYEDKFYSECCKHITDVITNGGERCRDSVDKEYITLRDMKLK